jgi:hypothetical protein
MTGPSIRFVPSVLARDNRIRHRTWDPTNFITITAVGRDHFLAVGTGGEASYAITPRDQWVEYVEPPVPYRWVNIHAESGYHSREAADGGASESRQAVVIGYTDGHWEVEDVR